MFLIVFECEIDMGVSKNRGTPKSSILIGFSVINHPFGGTPIFGNTHIVIFIVYMYFKNEEPAETVFPHSLTSSSQFDAFSEGKFLAVHPNLEQAKAQESIDVCYP